MRAISARQVWVLAHRYAGLFLAGFLILEGLSGSVLAFKAPIGEWLAPRIYAPPHPGLRPLGLGVLATRLEAMEPRARVGFFSIDGRQAVFSLRPRTDPATGRPYELGFDHIVLDPWTGRELARQRYGDLSQGAMNIVPFIDKLHQNLAIGGWGTMLLGVVAVLWTIDCFMAVYLTLPVARARFLSRWRSAWMLKWPASVFRLNFDLHRAGGLWLWPALFVFAWSSVMFTLPDQVYAPVTKTLFSYMSDADVFARMDKRPPRAEPRLDWIQAQAAGERLMARAAAQYGVRVIRPYGMAYIPGWNVYTYAVDSDSNVQAHGWGASLWLDGDSGQLVEADVATNRRFGNTVDTWLRALHFADLHDSLLYRIIVCLLGLAVAAISTTGVYIWWKKRQARKRSTSKRNATTARPQQSVA